MNEATLAIQNFTNSYCNFLPQNLHDFENAPQKWHFEGTFTQAWTICQNKTCSRRRDGGRKNRCLMQIFSGFCILIRSQKKFSLFKIVQVLRSRLCVYGHLNIKLPSRGIKIELGLPFCIHQEKLFQEFNFAQGIDAFIGKAKPLIYLWLIVTKIYGSFRVCWFSGRTSKRIIPLLNLFWIYDFEVWLGMG